MDNWVAEIHGRAVVVFSAASRALADELIDDLDFRGDLLILVDEEHRRVWDGKAEITVRVATAEEAETWEELLAEAIEDEDFTDREEALETGFAAYLFPVHEAH